MTPIEFALHTCIILPKLVVLGQTVQPESSRRSAWKKWPIASRLSRSFKVIGTDTDPSATYDFLLKFQNNNGPISYRFRDNRRFQSKIANFPILCVYQTPLLKGFPLELGTGAWRQKLEWWVYRAEKEIWRHLQPSGYNTRMWQTDGQTPNNSKDRAYAQHRAVKITCSRTLLWTSI